MRHEQRQPFPSSPSYQAVVRALLRDAQLYAEAKDESEEADADSGVQ